MGSEQTKHSFAPEAIGVHLLRASQAEQLRSLESAAGAAGVLFDTLALCHHLQAERGASCLNAGLARGEELCDPATLRKRTTAAIATLRSGASHLLSSGQPFPASAGKPLGMALSKLGELDTIRDRIDGRDISADEVFAWYCRIISCLLSVVAGIEGGSLTEIAQLLATLSCLAEAKESAGCERAAILRGFGMGALNADQREHLADLIQKQESLLATAAAFLEATGSSVSLDELDFLTTPLERFRRQALSARPPTDRSGEAWFQVSSARMDWLHRLEASLADRIATDLGKATARLRDADRDDIREMDERESKPGVVVFPSFGLPAASLPPGKAGFAGPLADLLIESSRKLRELRGELESARADLEDRKLIEQAKGLLMKHKNLGEDAAYRLLREEAMRRSVRISEVAASLIRSAPLWNQ